MATLTNTAIAKRVCQVLGHAQENDDPEAPYDAIVKAVIADVLPALRKKNLATWADDATPDYIVDPYVMYLANKAYHRMGGQRPEVNEMQALSEMRRLTYRPNVSGQEVSGDYF